MDEKHDQWLAKNTCEVFGYFGYLHDKEQMKTDVTTMLILTHFMLMEISKKLNSSIS